MRSIALILALFSFSCFSQQVGFFGKKTIIELNAQGAYPLIGNKTIYKVSSKGNLVESRNFFDGGFHVGITTARSPIFAIGLEFNINRQEFQPNSGTTAVFENDNGSTHTQWVNARFENVDFSSQTVLFKLEFAGRKSLLPVGISHQLGFGFSRSKIIDKDYLEEYYFTSQQEIFTLNYVNDLDDNLDFARVHQGLMVLYRINFRTAVSRSLVLNYGTQFTVNTTRRTNIASEANSLIRRRRIRSAAQLYFGMGFVF